LALYRQLHQQEDLHGTAWATERLANALWLQRRLPEAEQACRDALLACAKCRAVDSWVYASAARQLLDVLQAEDKPAEIEALCRAVLAELRAASSNDGPVEAETLIRLAELLQSAGKTVEAGQAFGKGWTSFSSCPTRTIGLVEHTATGRGVHAQGRSLEAVKLYEKRSHRRKTRRLDAVLGTTLHRYGDLLFISRKSCAAAELYLQALPIVRDSPPAAT
jgi:tetratricopeptide (TPR) repeat protein